MQRSNHPKQQRLALRNSATPGPMVWAEVQVINRKVRDFARSQGLLKQDMGDFHD